MENKQTAVEWLIQELGEYFPNDIGGINYLVETAKQMEKEQIINAFGEKRQFIGFDDNEHFGIKEVTGEEYYKLTYGKGN